MAGRRDFSYETGDDAQHAHDVSPLRSPTPTSYPRYQDSPNRDSVSPPPQYSSPPPQIMYRHTADRDDGADEDDDAHAPPPPPHRASPTRLLPISTVQSPQPQDSMLRAPSLPSTPSSCSPSPHPADREFQRGSYGSASLPSSQLLESQPYTSHNQLAGAAATPGLTRPIYDAGLAYSNNSIPLSEYPSSQGMAFHHDSPYQRSSQYLYPAVSEAHINPNAIIDDGDDGFMPEPQRRSLFPIANRDRDRSGDQARYVGAGSAASSSPGFMSRLFGKKAAVSSSRSSSGHDSAQEEKSEWLSRQRKGSNRMRWVVGLAIGAVITLAIVAGVVGGVGSRKSSSSGNSTENDSDSPVPGSTNNAATDLQENGDLNITSKEIQALMNNDKLHKVFPAIDYTPWGTQYPLCLTYPPSSNNVTRDMAVLSQLTNTVRLYGTDCNQTEMVIHSIKQLELTKMKIWLGVWIDTNQTTTKRQIAQLYDLLEANKDDLSLFKGVIIGNEALYRAGEDKAQSEQELIDYLNDARSKFEAKGYDLPLATSDLGDNWNAQLVQAVDYVMSNIHPFFAGVTAEVAASWTWTFWQEHDVVLTEGNSSVKQVISETGWPSGGGTDCGGTTGDCASGQSGAVASVDNMNTFMDNWVCQALENGTDYFWFEAFDEPWKVVYNTDDQKWEDQWGLMDPARKLKSGLTIPDCDGKTVS